MRPRSPVGHFCPEGTIVPQPCPNGTHLPTEGGGTSRASCIPCSPGQHSAGEGKSQCDKCAPGTFSEDVGATVCADCPLGG